MLTKRALAVTIGGEIFIEALQKYGASAVLDFLVKQVALPLEYDTMRNHYRLCKGSPDWILNELLVVWTSTVAMSDFLKRIPVFTVTPEEFEHWSKSGSFL